MSSKRESTFDEHLSDYFSKQNFFKEPETNSFLIKSTNNIFNDMKPSVSRSEQAALNDLLTKANQNVKGFKCNSLNDALNKYQFYENTENKYNSSDVNSSNRFFNSNTNFKSLDHYQYDYKSRERAEPDFYKIQELNRKKEPLKELCSYRLLPTRHQTKNAILNILHDGEVCIEFLKKKSNQKREIVCEVCRISPDGKRIVLYEPDSKDEYPGLNPPPLPVQGTDHIYGLENLPEKHWKKYTYAKKFVDLIRAKTPKVTFYTDKAKCLLMENLIDFEACFYEGKHFYSPCMKLISFFIAINKTYSYHF